MAFTECLAREEYFEFGGVGLLGLELVLASQVSGKVDPFSPRLSLPPWWGAAEPPSPSLPWVPVGAGAAQAACDALLTCFGMDRACEGAWGAKCACRFERDHIQKRFLSRCFRIAFMLPLP